MKTNESTNLGQLGSRSHDAIWNVLWAFETPKSADPDGPAKLDRDLLTNRDVIEARRALDRLAR